MNLRLGILCAVTCAALTGTATGQTYRSGAVATIAVDFDPPGEAFGADGLVWTRLIAPPVTDGSDVPPELRLRLSVTSLPDDGDFRIEIADSSGRVFDRIEPGTLTAGGTYWTLTVPANAAEVSVYGPTALDGLAFQIDRIAYPMRSTALESIFGDYDLIEIKDYDGPHVETVMSVESSVARLSFNTGSATDNCTAFRVGPDLIQTSSHCVSDARTCETAVALFGYQKNAFNANQRGQEVRCTEVVATQGKDGADTALLRVSPVPEDKYAIVSFRDEGPAEDEALFIVQHPGGGTKQLAIVECARHDNDDTRATPNVFGHSCDTKGGSSGAPLFSMTGLVVGQQRSGHDNPDLTTQPNLATPSSLLLLATGTADYDPPVGASAPAGVTATAAPIGTARPLPLPIAPQVSAVTAPPEGNATPSVVSPGSKGGAVAPDPKN